MQLIVLHGPPAAGKYTIGSRLAALTGLPLFHNHLVVDAVASVFPFGSPGFVMLRERFWRDVIGTAVGEGRSLIFTFQPEPSVTPGFADDLARIVTTDGGRCRFVRLTLAPELQRQRIAGADRARFGKLRDADLLARLAADFAACEAAMPASELTIDTGTTPPDAAAARIAALL